MPRRTSLIWNGGGWIFTFLEAIRMSWMLNKFKLYCRYLVNGKFIVCHLSEGVLLIVFSLYVQIFGAWVNILEVRLGSSEGVVEILGTPQQTNAAQSLIDWLEQDIFKDHNLWIFSISGSFQKKNCLYLKKLFLNLHAI